MAISDPSGRFHPYLFGITLKLDFAFSNVLSSLWVNGVLVIKNETVMYLECIFCFKISQQHILSASVLLFNVYKLKKRDYNRLRRLNQHLSKYCLEFFV